MKTRILKVLTLIMAIVMVAQFMVGCGSSEEDIGTKKPKKKTEIVTDIDKVTDKLPGTDPVFPPATDKPDVPPVTDKPDDPYVPPVPEEWLPQYETEHIKAREVPVGGMAYDISDAFVKYKDNIVAKSEVDSTGIEYIISLGDNRYRAVGDWGSRDFEASDVKKFLCEPSIIGGDSDGLAGYIDKSGIVHDVINNLRFSESNIDNRQIINYAKYYGGLSTTYLSIITITSDHKINHLLYNMDTGVVTSDHEIEIRNNYSQSFSTVIEIKKLGPKCWWVKYDDENADLGEMSLYTLGGDLKIDGDVVYSSGDGYYASWHYDGDVLITYDSDKDFVYLERTELKLPESYSTNDIVDMVYNDSWLLIDFWPVNESHPNYHKHAVYIYDIHTYNNGKNDFFVYDEELTGVLAKCYWIYEKFEFDTWGDMEFKFYMRGRDGFLYEYDIDDAYERLYDPSSKIDF